MPQDIYYNIDFLRSKKKYLSTLRYLKQIRKTGKIHLLTRSQINAIRSRLSQCLTSIKRYLKLVTVSTGICAMIPMEVDAQCQMNRLPISNQTSFSTFSLFPQPAFVDIDEDGDLDLVIGHRYGNISVYENNAGYFKRLSGLLNPFDGIIISEYNASPTFVDIDGDSDSDAFIGSQYGVIRFYRNENGHFSEVNGAGNIFNNVDVGKQVSLTFVDMDDDGDSDAFIGSDEGIRYLKNDNSVFNEVTGADNIFDGIDVGHSPHPTFADIDNDGDSDAIIGGVANKYFRNDNGNFIEITGVGNPFNNLEKFWNPAFVDIDGDGDLDAFSGGSSIHFYKNDNNVFSEVVDPDISFPTLTFDINPAPTLGDLDGDNDEDVFVGTSDGTIRSFINDNGLFNEATGTNNPFNVIDVGSYAKPVLIDIDPTDSDTDLDLIVGNGSGEILYFKNTNDSFTRLEGGADPFGGIDIGSHAAPTFVDFDGDNDKDAFVGTQDGTILYFRNDNGTFNEITGSGNPFDGVNVGSNATPAFFRFNPTRALIGASSGKVREYAKIANQYVLVTESPFQGIDALNSSTPTFVSNSNRILIGSYWGTLFAFSDQGMRSNVWQGPFTENWHGPLSNWELMTIPKSGCDEVHVFGGSVLKVDATQMAEGRTLTVRQGGQFEVKAAAELSIDPD